MGNSIDEYNILARLDSGSINYLHIPKEDGKYSKYDESLEIELHFARVMGLFYDSDRQLLHSVSKDGHYRVMSMED